MNGIELKANNTFFHCLALKDTFTVHLRCISVYTYDLNSNGSRKPVRLGSEGPNSDTDFSKMLVCLHFNFIILIHVVRGI